jgi:hypothetical protein
MTYAKRTDDLPPRCRQHLLRLRMLTRAETGAMLPWQVTAEVRATTNAVIAEAEASGRAALAAGADGRGEPEAGVFLWVRLTRLAAAADEAVSAARGTDATRLHRYLHRFEVLAAAIWTVQDAVYGQVPLPRDDRAHAYSAATSPAYLSST